MVVRLIAAETVMIFQLYIMRGKRESLLTGLEWLESHQSPKLQGIKCRKDEDPALAVFLS